MTTNTNINGNLPALSTRLAKVASALSGNSGITITFNGNDCCTDMQGNIRLPIGLAIAMAEGDEEAKRLMFGKVAHEKGHDAVQRSTSFLAKARKKAVLTKGLQAGIVAAFNGNVPAGYTASALTKSNGALTVTSLMKRLPSKAHRMWFNAIEDVRMERGLTLDGERIFVAHNRTVAATKWADNIAKGQKVHPMLATSVAVIFKAHDIDISFMPAEVHAALDSLSAFTALLGTDSADDSQVKTVWDAYNLALAIVEFINDDSNDEQGEAEGDEQGEQGEQAQDQDGDAQSDEQGEAQGDEGAESDEDGTEGEGQGEGQGDEQDAQDGQGEGEGDGEGEGEQGEVQDEHTALSEGSEDGEGDDSQGIGGYAQAATGDNDMTHVKDIDVSAVNPFKVLRNPSDWDLTEEPLESAIDEAIKQAGHAVYNDLSPEGLSEVENAWTVSDQALKHDRLTVLEASQWDIDRYNEAGQELGGKATTIAGQLRALLTARSLSRRQGDQDAGRLDRRALHRLNRPGMLPSKNVFERSIAGQSHNVAIMVMLDCSGSMYGSKMRLARKSLHVLGNALTGLETLGVKWASYGFTTHRKGNTNGYQSRTESLQHYTFKSFDENWRRSNIAARTYSNQIDMNCNCDSDSIRWALAELMKQKADRHILLVLSDGQPAFRGYSSGQTALKATIEGARKVGVEVGSIGIQTHDPQAYYGEDTPVIMDVNELPKALLDQARSWFIK